MAILWQKLDTGLFSASDNCCHVRHLGLLSEEKGIAVPSRGDSIANWRASSQGLAAVRDIAEAIAGLSK